MKNGRIIIAGTGRAGTTLLMQVFTKLGLDTGFSEKDFSSEIDSISFGGLEKYPQIESLEKLPRVVKSPWFFEIADDFLAKASDTIEYVLIPIRNLNCAAQSRIRIQRIFETRLGGLKSKGNRFRGGLAGTDSEQEQEVVLGRQITSLIISLSESNVPFKFVVFPKFAQDPDYLYEIIKFLIPDTSFEEFHRIFQELVDLSKIHF